MATLRLFAGAREIAGVAQIEIEANSVAELLSAAASRFGDDFGRVLGISKIWLNGEEVNPDSPVKPGDEVAVLPPVSGGA